MSCLFRTSHFGYDKVRDICANGETVIVNWGASDWLWNAFGVLLVVSIVLIVASSVLLTTMLALLTTMLALRNSRKWRKSP